MVDTAPEDEEGEHAKFKTYTRPKSVEALELMPLDVPDILVKKSKVSVSHGKSEAANISSASRKEVQIGKLRPPVTPINKSVSMPEPGFYSETDRQATKIHSEPMISGNFRTESTTNRVMRIKKRRSGPLISPSFPPSVSVASGETTMLQGKELRSDVTQKENLTLKDSDREEHFYIREDE